MFLHLCALILLCACNIKCFEKTSRYKFDIAIDVKNDQNTRSKMHMFNNSARNKGHLKGQHMQQQGSFMFVLLLVICSKLKSF